MTVAVLVAVATTGFWAGVLFACHLESAAWEEWLAAVHEVPDRVKGMGETRAYTAGVKRGIALARANAAMRGGR